MILDIVVLVAGAAVGFALSRALRRPRTAAQAASVARNVSASFGGRRGLTAPELQRACFSEMIRHVQVTRQGRTIVPSTFEIRMHPDDVALAAESKRWFTDGLRSALRDAASDGQWSLDGDVDINFTPDPSRRPGVPTALAVQPHAAQASPAPPPEQLASTATVDRPTARLELIRTDTDERVTLAGDSVTVGRSRERTLTIDDNRVSRSHVHFERRQRGWVVVDEGSANGTRLDGQELAPHQPTPVRDGSVINVGPFELRIATVSVSSEPGTRALDDSDRHRISRDYLPPSENRP